MRAHTLFVLLALTACSPSESGPKAEDRKVPAGRAVSEERPRIAFAETAHDFGHVSQGESLEHVFTFRNAGTGTLKIERVQGS